LALKLEQIEVQNCEQIFDTLSLALDISI
jgi:hypothetical protein